MTIPLHAERKGRPLDRMEVRFRQIMHAAGAAKDVFSRAILLDGDLSAEERQRLFEIAARPPVSLTLTTGVLIQSTLTELPLADVATA